MKLGFKAGYIFEGVHIEANSSMKDGTKKGKKRIKYILCGGGPQRHWLTVFWTTSNILDYYSQQSKWWNFKISVYSWLFPLVLRDVFHTIQSTKLWPHQMSSAFFKEEWKRMVTSAAQAQGRQDAVGIHLPPDSTQPFLERRKVSFQHCEPLCPNLMIAPRWCTCIWGHL